MLIETKDFGQIEVTEDKIIQFQDGIPGFEDEKEFAIIINEDEENPFHYILSINTPDLYFVVTNPFDIYEDYEIEIPKPALEKLKIENKEDVLVFSIVVIPEDIKKMTTNLLGPIIINAKERLGKQVVLDDDRYSTRHYLVPQKEDK